MLKYGKKASYSEKLPQTLNRSTYACATEVLDNMSTALDNDDCIVDVKKWQL